MIRDRDRCYGTDFIAKASLLGIHTIRTPVHAPNANAIAERVIETLRRECLDYLIVLNEQHLLRVLHEYTAHYNANRSHRSLAFDSPDGREVTPRPPGAATVVRHEVLGGLRSKYHWPHDVLHPHGCRTSASAFSATVRSCLSLDHRVLKRPLRGGPAVNVGEKRSRRAVAA